MFQPQFGQQHGKPPGPNSQYDFGGVKVTHLFLFFKIGLAISSSNWI